MSYLRRYINVGWRRECLNSGTSAILLTSPSTLVSTVDSPGNFCSTWRNKSRPPSAKNTPHVVGDSSVTDWMLKLSY